MVDQGIDHLVSLSPEKIPPAYAYPKYFLSSNVNLTITTIIVTSDFPVRPLIKKSLITELSA